MRAAPPLTTLLIAISITSPLFADEVAAPDKPAAPVTFEHDIQPLLTRFGCNSGPCHGKSRGQNGFALSLLGFDSQFDYGSIVHQSRGRRITPSAPDNSLLLQKAIGAQPHGGGIRFERASKPYSLIREWIAAGGPATPADAPDLLKVEIVPSEIDLATQQSAALTVYAHYSNGSRRNVTDAAAFQSHDSAIATVTPDGELTAGPIAGEAAVMARYCNHITVCHVSIPLGGDVPGDAYVSLPRTHEIDSLVWEKLERLKVLPSELADAATIHRRAYLRIIGRLPSPAETRAYLADPAADKYDSLVNHLLDRPEYADFWANKWADLLRPNPYRVGIKATWTLDAWLRNAFRENIPYDQFVRELVTATGSTWLNGATVIYRDRPATVEIASSVSQLFLGVRLECAKCHHHPFEVWSQDDFYGFAAFFARVGHRGGLSPPISGAEELIFTKKSGKLKHGRTDLPVQPQTLHGEPVSVSEDQDPRVMLADWMTDSQNPYFAHVMANRVWGELMGRGIVEPIDDIRITNPATNQPLLDHLATEFRASGYDIKQLIRRIATSRVFRLSTTPHPRNVSDSSNFARYYRQRLRAEVLLDGVNDVLGTQESFAAMPAGSRATALWTHRSDSQFLDTFGRPDRNQDPPCERTTDSTTPQILHLMNSVAFNKKLHDAAARPAKLAEQDQPTRQIVEDAYLRIYCRFPSDDEATIATASINNSDDRRAAVEDLFWALLNTPEFLYID